ncbi:MAG: hypothetical protein KC561_11480, partial [Myxococcales bacterium]|nr:hypothetical protein [Myxococcales bacterium]
GDLWFTSPDEYAIYEISLDADGGPCTGSPSPQPRIVTRWYDPGTDSWIAYSDPNSGTPVMIAFNFRLLAFGPGMTETEEVLAEDAFTLIALYAEERTEYIEGDPFVSDVYRVRVYSLDETENGMSSITTKDECSINSAGDIDALPYLSATDPTDMSPGVHGDVFVTFAPDGEDGSIGVVYGGGGYCYTAYPEYLTNDSFDGDPLDSPRSVSAYRSASYDERVLVMNQDGSTNAISRYGFYHSNPQWTPFIGTPSSVDEPVLVTDVQTLEVMSSFEPGSIEVHPHRQGLMLSTSDEGEWTISYEATRNYDYGGKGSPLDYFSPNAVSISASSPALLTTIPLGYKAIGLPIVEGDTLTVTPTAVALPFVAPEMSVESNGNPGELVLTAYDPALEAETANFFTINRFYKDGNNCEFCVYSCGYLAQGSCNPNEVSEGTELPPDIWGNFYSDRYDDGELLTSVPYDEFGIATLTLTGLTDQVEDGYHFGVTSSRESNYSYVSEASINEDPAWPDGSASYANTCQSAIPIPNDIIQWAPGFSQTSWYTITVQEGTHFVAMIPDPDSFGITLAAYTECGSPAEPIGATGLFPQPLIIPAADIDTVYVAVSNYNFDSEPANWLVWQISDEDANTVPNLAMEDSGDGSLLVSWSSPYGKEVGSIPAPPSATVYKVEYSVDGGEWITEVGGDDYWTARSIRLWPFEAGDEVSVRVSVGVPFLEGANTLYSHSQTIGPITVSATADPDNPPFLPIEVTTDFSTDVSETTATMSPERAPSSLTLSWIDSDGNWNTQLAAEAEMVSDGFTQTLEVNINSTVGPFSVAHSTNENQVFVTVNGDNEGRP